MEVKKYIKKPIPIEAVLVKDNNYEDVIKWIEENNGEAFYRDGYIYVKTLEGYIRGF